MIMSVCSKFSNRLSDFVTARCLVCWMIFYTMPVHGLELPEGVQFHGFASQGYSLTTENNFFGNSQDNGSFEYRELGVNGSWLPFTNLQLSGQLLYRRAGETDPGKLRLDYGLIDYSFLSTETNRWGFRLGRIKNPTGFYNETRDVAFTRPSILLPQSIYPDDVRSLALSSDGLAIYGERRTDYGDFFLQSGLGYPQTVDRELEGIVFGRRTPGGFNSDTSYIGRLLYEWNSGLLKTAITYFQANLDYNSATASTFPIPDGSLRIEPWIFSLQYNKEIWSLTSEYSLRKVTFRGFGQPNNTTTGQDYYIQGSYRLFPQWEAILRYDVEYIDINDKNGKKYVASDPLGRPAYSRYAKDWTTGLNWTVTPQFLLRAEYHHINGTSWLPTLDNPDPYGTSRNWNLFLFLGSYRF